LASGDVTSQVRARAELGYVDFLRARYERAEYRFRDALVQAEGDPSTMAKVASYLGSVLSDLGSYPAAIALLTESVEWAQEAGEPRREAYSRSMLGRVELLRGRLDDAAAHLDASIRLAEQDHWLAFAPWPQALRGELHLASGDVDGAEALLRQSFARACQVADPCWEGTATRGLALVADARGDAAESFRLLADAERRANRHADPYVWLDGYILDARCALGLRHRHPETARWIEQLRELASRTGMKELLVRSHVHAAGLGDRDAGAAAAFLVSDVDNDVLHRLVDALGHSRRARPVVAQQPHVSA
jgi:tetratricopeptide (TPR) repeat protein